MTAATSSQRPEPLTTAEYGRLLDECWEPAAGYALSILRNRTDAQDAVQQAALRGLERLAQYDPQRPFKGWWYTVLRNCCIDLLRSRRKHISLEQADSPHMESPAIWQDLSEGLDRLDPQQSEILRLRYFGGLTYDDLSQTLAIPKGTVMSRLHYARLALADLMKE